MVVKIKGLWFGELPTEIVAEQNDESVEVEILVFEFRLKQQFQFCFVGFPT